MNCYLSVIKLLLPDIFVPALLHLGSVAGLLSKIVALTKRAASHISETENPAQRSFE